MKRLFWLALLGAAAVGLNWQSGDANAQEKKGKVVELDGMKAAVPAEWVQEKPANRMRFLQFRLPKVEGDKTDAELYIFRGLGGNANENIKRWRDMFIPPEGKTIEDVSKVSKIKIGKDEAPYLEVWGTYKYKAAPFDPKSKAELRPNQRMLNIHYEGQDEVYHFRLVGPDKTVQHYKKGFEDWLKALKK